MKGTEPVGITRVTSTEVPTESAPADESVTRNVEATLASELDLESATKNVEVSVVEGIVTLRGAVAEVGDKRRLEELVARVPGVVDVLDKVEVSPARAEDVAAIDDRIAFSIQRAFMTSPELAGAVEHVTIDVSSGGVVLRGEAPSEEMRRAVERAVFDTPGVVDIKNRLEVASR